MPNDKADADAMTAELIDPSSHAVPLAGNGYDSTVDDTIKTEHINQHEFYLKKWHRSLSILHQGHWDAARKYERTNMRLGILTAIAATVSGTTAFAQLKDQDGFKGLNFWMQIVVGTFALAAAALGAVQASLRPSELAGRHKQAAQKYGQLRRKLEVHLEEGLPSDHNRREEILNGLRCDWDKVDEECLPVPKRIYDKAEARFKKKHGHSHGHGGNAN